jgi:hypothetical protein
MIDRKDYTRVQWGTFPTDVTSPLPSQRLGSSSNKRDNEYKPTDRPVDRPAAVPSPPPSQAGATERCR